MNFLLPPMVAESEVSAFSELEEQLRGAQREQFLAHTRQRLLELESHLQGQLHRGGSPAEYRVIGAVQDACSAALEVLDSL